MKKYVLSYTVYADDEQSAYDELSSAIFHGGVKCCGITEVPFEDYEIKIIEEAKKMNYGGINDKV